MDDQIIDLIRDQFKTLNEKIDSSREATHEKIENIHNDVRGHIEKDERYWQKIDTNEAQLSLIKWLFSGASGSAILAWIYNKFGH